MPTQFEQPSPTTPTSAASFTSSTSIFVDAEDNLIFSPLSASTHHSHSAYSAHAQGPQQHISHPGHASRYSSRSGAGAGLSTLPGFDTHRRGSVATSEGEDTDEDGNFAKELAQIEQLRRNVKKNLLLRPISTQNLRASASAAPAAASSVPGRGPSKASPSQDFTGVSKSQDVSSPTSGPGLDMPGSYPLSPPPNAGPATVHFAKALAPFIAVPEPEDVREVHDHHHDYPPLSAASNASEVFYSARPISNGSVSSYYFGHSPPGSTMKASFQVPENHATPGKLQINTETAIDLEEPSPDPYGRQQFYTAKSPNSASFVPPQAFRELAYSQATAALEGRLHPQTSNQRPASSPGAASISSPSPSSGIPEQPLVYEPTSLLPVLHQLSSRTYLSPRNSTFGAVSRPLLLDTRPSGSYLASRIVYSINIAIPSLILKRFRKQHQRGGTGFKDLHALRGYISTESGRTYWDVLISGKSPVTGSAPGQIWSGEIIVFDEDMDENDPLAPKQQERVPSIASTPTSTGSSSSALSTPSTAAWTLLTLLRPLTTGPIHYLKGGISAMRKLEGTDEVIVSGEWEIQESDSEEEANADLDEGSDAAASSTTNSMSGMTTSDSTPSTGTPSHPLTQPLKLKSSSSQGNLAASSGGNTTRLGSSGNGSSNLGSSPNPKGTPKGLFSIRTDVAAKHRPLPEIEPPTTSPKLADIPPRKPGAGDALRLKPPPSPRLMPPPSPRRAATLAIDTTTPLISNGFSQMPEWRPSESKIGGHVRNLSNESNQSKTPQSAILVLPNSPPKQQPRRPSAIHIPTSGLPDQTFNEEPMPQPLPGKSAQKPRLAKLDLSSMERLTNPAQGPEANAKASLAIDTANTISKGPPKLQLRTGPMKSHTIASDKLDVPTLRPPAMSKLKISLNTLNTSNAAYQSNVLIVNTPSSPDNTYLDTHFGEKRSTSLSIPSSPSQANGAPFGENSSSRPRTPKTPLTPLLPPSPMTARPGNGPEPTSPSPVFTISTILPNFLYLGPELVQEHHVKELEGMGVRRILNLAIECEDDANLGLRERFERYVKIPMRDTVEEVNVGKAMREVCDILDDARLHSSPTYVHCKAGKSRSVTAVMAYLIHANHWTLSKAYAFVLDRRKGISPNIGFVSELMNFEEDELGGKSVGVVGGSGNESSHGRRTHNHQRQHRQPHNGDDGSRTARRRPAHLRESMPPIVQSYSAMAAVGEHDSLSLTGGLNTSYSQPGYMGSGSGDGSGGHLNGDVAFANGGPNGSMMSAGPVGKSHVPMRDVGEDMEVRDSEGRYRHARRAPVDELTLQPVRRVSKAGLESTWIESLSSL